MARGPHDADEPGDEPVRGAAEDRPGDDDVPGGPAVTSPQGEDGPEAGPDGSEAGPDDPAGRPGPDGADPASPDAAVPGPAAQGAGADSAPRAEVDVDARWREIIAELGDLTEPGQADGAPHGPVERRRPARRDLRPGERRGDGRQRLDRPWDTGPDSTLSPGGTGTPERRPGSPGPGADRAPTDGPDPEVTARPEAHGGASGFRSWSPDPALEEADDHFHPPEPGPVLGGDPLLTLAWGAVVGMPALFLLTVLLWRDVPTAVLLGAAVMFLVGLGVLLWRMPHRRDDDAGPGAVV